MPGSWQHEKVNCVFNPEDEGALCSKGCFMMTTRLEQTVSEKTVARDAVVKAIYFLRRETKQSHLLQAASQRWMSRISFEEKHFISNSPPFESFLRIFENRYLAHISIEIAVCCTILTLVLILYDAKLQPYFTKNEKMQIIKKYTYFLTHWH